ADSGGKVDRLLGFVRTDPVDFDRVFRAGFRSTEEGTMRLVRTLGVLGLAVAAAPAANAVPLHRTPTVICLVSGGRNSCASVTVTVSGSVLTATVENTSSGADHYLMPSFGFFFEGT